MRPRTSEAKRKRWRDFPLAAPGIHYRPGEMEAINSYLAEGNVASAQRLILDKLQTHFYGPRTVACQARGKRKRLVAR